jgi:hypothetical protein
MDLGACQIHTPLRFCPSGARPQPQAGSTPHWDACPSGHAMPQLMPDPHTTSATPDPRPELESHSAGILPQIPPHLRPCQALAPCGMTRATPHQDPYPWALPNPNSLGCAPAQFETAASPILLRSPALRWSLTPALKIFQITAPPGSHLGCHQRNPNLPKIHTDRTVC